MNSLRICHVTVVHPWDDARILERGIQVTLIAPVPAEMTVEGVQMLPAGLRNKIGRLVAAPCLLLKLRRARAAIYHFHDPELLPWMYLFQRCVPSAAVIYDVHEYYPEQLKFHNYLGRPLLNSLMSRVVRQVEPRLARGLRGVIGVTEPIAARFENGKARIAVIRNVAKLKAIPPRGKLRDPFEEPQIVVGSYLTPSRYVEELIEAIGLLKNRGLKLRLLVVGRPWPPGYAGRLRTVAARCQIHDQVLFLDRVPFECFQRFISQSCLGMVLMAPLVHHQLTVPIRLFEFMAHGLPIIASDLPEVARVIRDAGCGILIDSAHPTVLADAMENLLRDREMAQLLGANGRKAVEDRYCWERELDILIAFYHSLVGNSSHRNTSGSRAAG
jgi:glycosyltransferase involved in cell wall biosynthesis